MLLRLDLGIVKSRRRLQLMLHRLPPKLLLLRPLSRLPLLQLLRAAYPTSTSSNCEPPPSTSPTLSLPSPFSNTNTVTYALPSALTAEHLESAFYKEGFAKFPASDFLALGLTQDDITALQKVGETEATHVTTLLSVISAAGAKPVEPCVYNFEAAFADAATMVATARVLEAIGVSAYLGAAPLVSSSDVLAAAASIVTVEARHNALIRVLSGAAAVPAAFDVALGPRAVFTLAAPFISSCPDGSNLNIPAFPSISLVNPEQAQVGQNLKLTEPGTLEGAQFCAFVAG